MIESHKEPKLTVSYDASVDVLYVTLLPAPCDGWLLERGVQIEYSALDGTACGLTVFGYNRHQWPDCPNNLANIGAKHLNLKPEHLNREIRAAVGNQMRCQAT